MSYYLKHASLDIFAGVAPLGRDRKTKLPFYDNIPSLDSAPTFLTAAKKLIKDANGLRAFNSEDWYWPDICVERKVVSGSPRFHASLLSEGVIVAEALGGNVLHSINNLSTFFSIDNRNSNNLRATRLHIYRYDPDFTHLVGDYGLQAFNDHEGGYTFMIEHVVSNFGPGYYIIEQRIIGNLIGLLAIRFS